MQDNQWLRRYIRDLEITRECGHRLVETLGMDPWLKMTVARVRYKNCLGLYLDVSTWRGSSYLIKIESYTRTGTSGIYLTLTPSEGLPLFYRTQNIYIATGVIDKIKVYEVLKYRTSRWLIYFHLIRQRRFGPLFFMWWVGIVGLFMGKMYMWWKWEQFFAVNPLPLEGADIYDE